VEQYSLFALNLTALFPSLLLVLFSKISKRSSTIQIISIWSVSAMYGLLLNG